MSKSGKSSPRKKAAKKATASKTSLRIARAKIAVPHAGLTFNHKHYVFIAKLKRGEIQALNQLSDQAKTTVTPLFEMWPPNPGTPTRPAKTLTEHTTDLMQILTSEWTGLPCYIDTRYLTSGGQPSPASAQTVFNIARNLAVNAVPVTSLAYGPPFQQVIRGINAVDGRGVMIRLALSYFNAPQNLAGYLDGIAAFLQVVRNQIDILIDLEFRPNVIEVQQMGAYCLNNLPFINDWRTVTLAAGCFPVSISDEPSGQWLDYPRSDWNGWNTVASQRATANTRVPSYGDYGVRCGGEPLVIPNTPAPNIRYTAAQTVRTRKGPKAPGATRAICQNLVTQPFFSGATFSQGDSEIAQKAATTNQTNGTPEQWIEWSTNHHLEMTASQIQNLP